LNYVFHFSIQQARSAEKRHAYINKRRWQLDLTRRNQINDGLTIFKKKATQTIGSVIKNLTFPCLWLANWGWKKL